jgi:hypothetical protein
MFVCVVLAVAVNGFAQNLLDNPGFEVWNPANEFDYTLSDWEGWTAGFQSWPAHSGTGGVYFPGWNAGPADAGVYQDVAATITQDVTYTFSVYVLQESGFNPTNFQVKLEYYNGAGTLKVQADTIGDYTHVTPDGRWHHYYVTGTATNTNDMAFVRGVVTAGWDTSAGGGGTAVFVDDAQLYVGSYTGIPGLVNDSFENGQVDTWRGSQWGSVPEDQCGPRDWAGRSGSRGVAYFGWDAGNFSVEHSQPLTMLSTGTYTLTAFSSRESDFLMTNFALGIEWYDATLTNQLGSVVTNVTMANDNTWREFYVTAEITNTDVFEVRPVIGMDFGGNTADLPGRAARVDDVRLLEGAYDGDSIVFDNGYFSAPGFNPMNEDVPGTNVGKFLQVDYETTTTTFYVLANYPSVAKYDPDEAGEVGVRTAWEDPKPAPDVWYETWVNASWVGNIVLSDADPFHGYPSSGSVTVDLWRYEWTQPLNTNVTPAVPYEDTINVYYSPFLRSRKDGFIETDFEYMLDNDGTRTNNVDQLFGLTYADNDFVYTQKWEVAAADTDGDGIPDWWENEYFGDLISSGIGSNYDEDASSDFEEYVADTVPTNPASVFVSQVTNTASAAGTTTLMAGPPTSTGRVYDVWWTTSLEAPIAWTRYGLDVPGISNTTPVMLTVTNDGANRIYRTGVTLP